MIDTRALDKAVANGVIDAGQAERIVLIATQLQPEVAPPPPAASVTTASDGTDPAPRDAENLRFIRGFSDIFVTIGIVLLIGPAVYFGDLQFADTASVAALIAVGAWVLAEYFTRVRMMALPSIVLLAVFTAASAVLFVDLLGAVDNDVLRRIPGLEALSLQAEADAAGRSGGVRAALAAVLTGIAVTFYYLRFRVPIAVAAGTGALVALFLSVTMILVPDLTDQGVRWLVAGCGAAVFLLAMRFDMADPQRQTRRTDIAFWLHVLAAPLIVHPILLTMFGGNTDSISADQATRVLLLFGAIGLVSVVIDRRSFLVAGLGYAGYAFSSLLSGAGVEESALPGTLFALGALILVLSAGWSILRRLLMFLVPPPISRRLPPTRT